MDVDTQQLVAEILNAFWVIRHYNRPCNRLQRAQAILKLGHILRHAFSVCDDFRALLAAIRDGMPPGDF